MTKKVNVSAHLREGRAVQAHDRTIQSQPPQDTGDVVEGLSEAILDLASDDPTTMCHLKICLSPQ